MCDERSFRDAVKAEIEHLRRKWRKDTNRQLFESGFVIDWEKVWGDNLDKKIGD